MINLVQIRPDGVWHLLIDQEHTVCGRLISPATVSGRFWWGDEPVPSRPCKRCFASRKAIAALNNQIEMWT